MANNSSMTRLKDDTINELKMMKDELGKLDRYAKTDYDSMINRAVRYWRTGDIDR